MYTTFKWGKNYEHFLQTCADLDIEMKKLTKFRKSFATPKEVFVFAADVKYAAQQTSNGNNLIDMPLLNGSTKNAVPNRLISLTTIVNQRWLKSI